MINSRDIFEIRWCGYTTYVLCSATHTENEPSHYAITAWDDKNATRRNWDERLNLLFDTQEAFDKRVSSLKKRMVLYNN